MTRRILVLLVLISLSSLAGVATPQGAPERMELGSGSAVSRAAAASQVPALPGAAHPVPAPSLASGNPAAVAVLPSSVPDVSELASPSGEVGTALYWATATWCAPTATQCQGWGGDAKLGAVNSFRFGDAPYWVRVWRLDRHVDVLIVSFCQCGGSDFAIDLSPSAFAVLAPLDRGRVDVAIEDLRGVANVPLPPTDAKGDPS